MFFSKLFFSDSCLGVDIGTTSIKIAEISNGSQRPRLVNYGILETQGHLGRANSALQTDSLSLADKETAKLISLLVERSKFKAKEVIASIPAFNAFISLIEIPQMSETDTQKAMSFQIKQYIPMSLDEVVIDWTKIGEKETADGVRQQILFISFPKEKITKYQNIFKYAGLKLKALEVESLSLVRSLAGNDPTSALLVDIGGYSTNIAVAEGGSLKLNSISNFAGASLTQAIANGLNIDARRAEELKRRRGLKAVGGEYQLSTLPQPYLDVIISEADRARKNFELKQNKKIERVIIAGGGANLIGIKEYFENIFGLPTVIGNAFFRVDYPKETEIFSKELGALMAVAIGLGIR